MNQPERAPHAREQIFLVSTGAFLLTYVVALLRTRQVEWVILISTAVLILTVAAGLVVTEVIPSLGRTSTRGNDAQDAFRGAQVDLTLDSEDASHPGHDDQMAAD